MTEEQISSTGQFTALAPTEADVPYRTPGSVVPQNVSAAPTVPAVAESAPAGSEVKAAKPTMQEIDNAIAAANANLAGANRLLDYRVDPATGINIAVIRNLQTGEVLQQIPGADLLALARMLAAWAPGKHMLLDLIA
jgi:uncharacterized FlaG/YvyC family protein